MSAVSIGSIRASILRIELRRASHFAGFRGYTSSKIESVMIDQDIARTRQLSSSQDFISSQIMTAKSAGNGSPLNSNASLMLLTENFGSRGSLMLRAALNDRAKRDNSMIVTPEKQHQEALCTKIGSETKVLRSPGCKVLFKDPVVTSHHEYEQTIIQCDSDYDDYSETKKSLVMQKIRSKKIVRVNNASNTLETQKATNDSPSTMKIKTKSPRKRPYRVSDRPNAESLDQVSTDNFVDCTSSHENCLFSSPKVAKIAPYYRETQESSKGAPQTIARIPGPTGSKRPPQSVTASNIATSEDASSATVCTKSETEAEGYFGWFTKGITTFFANQINKFGY